MRTAFLVNSSMLIKAYGLHQQGKQKRIVVHRNDQRILRICWGQSLYVRRLHIWLELDIQVRKHRKRCNHH